jgi:hypothetical protein
MQTTLRLDEVLMREVKALAASEGQSLTAFIEESLRIRLAGRESARKTLRPALPVASGVDGLMPGINLDDSSELIDAMEGL